MMRRGTRALILVAMASALAACDTTKTSNPLSPTVAGPIEGVVISAPKLLSPSAGQRIAAAEQPVTLTVENATTTGERPVKYVFEIAADAGFSNKLFTRADIPPGSDGRTSVKLADALATGRTYYWRAMAADGANSGPYAPAANFDVYAPVTLQAPVLVSPVDAATVAVLRPPLKTKNAARSGPVGAVTYTFQVSESQAFASVLLNGAVAEQANETTYVPTQDLAVARTYFWRVRAADPTTTGPWSVTQSFKTPVAGSPSPIPPGPGGGADQIDARAITWLEQASADVSGWTITSQVTEVVQSGDQVCVYHTKAGQWPLADVFGTGLGIEGVIMIVARFDGKWYGAGFDWMPGGRTCKNLTADEYGRDQIRVAPMDASWPGPKAGNQIGLLVSTPSSNRIPMRTVNERTNIALITWR
jgi:hypothetical protein